MQRNRIVVPWLAAVFLLLCAASTRAATIAWTRLGPPGPYGAVATAEPEPGHTRSLVFAGFFGDNVSGPAVLRSDDGGSTWQRTIPYRCYSLAAVPAAPGTIYAATDNGLFRSEDYGYNWALVTPLVRTWIAVNTGNDNILYGDFLRSLDRGQTWAPVPGLAANWAGADFHLKVSAGNPNFLIAYLGGISVVSQDGGETWTGLPDDSGGFYSVEADPIDPRFYYVGFCNILHRYYPGGSERIITSGDLLAFAVDPSSRNKVFLSAQFGEFWYSGDYGVTWSPLNSVGGEILFYGRMIVDGPEQLLYLPTGTGLYTTSTAALASPAPKVKTGSPYTGEYLSGTYVRTNTFTLGDEVVFRATILDRSTSQPVAGAMAYFSAGRDNVLSGPSNDSGLVEARWSPPADNVYNVTVTKVIPPAGMDWDGKAGTAFRFTVGPTVGVGNPVTGRYEGTTFVPATGFVIGDEIVLRTTVTDRETKLPVAGATVNFHIQPLVLLDLRSGPSNAEGVAEVRWVATAGSTYDNNYQVFSNNVVPPPGYFYDGYSGYSRFTVKTATAGTDSLVTGRYDGTTFVPAGGFTTRDAIVFRVAVVNRATGAPVPGATVTFSVTGPSAATVTSGASNAGGFAEATWSTATPGSGYAVDVKSMTLPTGYTWDGVRPGTGFGVTQATVTADPPVIGRLQTVKKVVTFVPTDNVAAGGTITFRTTLHVTGTQTPVPGATATFTVTGPEPSTDVVATVAAVTDAAGMAEGKWATVAPSRKGTGGTPKGIYRVTITGVTTPPDLSWDSVVPAADTVKVY